MKIKIVLAILISLSLVGCATTLTPQAMNVSDAVTNTVSNCKFVGTVSGTSGWGNLAASVGIKSAKNQARNKAAQLGANRIVWTSIQGGYSPYVSGNAYECK